MQYFERISTQLIRNDHAHADVLPFSAEHYRNWSYQKSPFQIYIHRHCDKTRPVPCQPTSQANKQTNRLFIII